MDELHDDVWACVALHVANVEALACVCSASRRAVTRVVDVVEANGTHHRAINVPMHVHAPPRTCFFGAEQHVHLQLGTLAHASFFFAFTLMANDLRLTSVTFHTPGGACYVSCDIARAYRVDVRVQGFGSLRDFARRHYLARKEDVVVQLRACIA